MSKQAIYYEEAKRLYVYDGFNLDTIVGMLEGKVSRKTLYNWKTEGEWDQKRVEHAKSTEDIQAQLIKLAKKALEAANANPSPHNVYAVTKAISALKAYTGVKLLDENTTKEQRKGLTEEATKQIKEAFGLE